MSLERFLNRDNILEGSIQPSNKWTDSLRSGGQLIKYPIDFSSFSDIASDNDKVYILNREGVISFDLKERKWSNVLNAALINGKNANALAVKNNIFFISTFDGVYKYDKISNLSEFYSYDFIKNINDVYIHNEFAFFGTRNGLISFRYNYR